MNSIRLPIGLVHRQDCFVALPKVAVRALYGSNRPNGAVAFAVSWQSTSSIEESPGSESGDSSIGRDISSGKKTTALSTLSAKRTVYVSWKGDISSKSKIEFPRELARCIGLINRETISTLETAFVQIEKTPSPRIISLSLDPVGEDDWEIIELNANYLEDSLLNQVCVLYAGQIFPVHIGTSGVVRLKVGDVEFEDGASCGMLGRDSELFVAPRDRKREHSEKLDEGNREIPTKTDDNTTARIEDVATTSVSNPKGSAEKKEASTLLPHEVKTPRLQLRVQPQSKFKKLDQTCALVHPSILAWNPLCSSEFAFLESIYTLRPQSELRRIMTRIYGCDDVAPGHIVIHSCTLGRMLRVAPLLSNVWLSPAVTQSGGFPALCEHASRTITTILLHPVYDESNGGRDKHSTSLDMGDIATKKIKKAFWKQVVCNAKTTQDGKKGGVVLGNAHSLVHLRIDDKDVTFQTSFVRKSTSSTKADQVWQEYQAKLDGNAAAKQPVNTGDSEGKGPDVVTNQHEDVEESISEAARWAYIESKPTSFVAVEERRIMKDDESIDGLLVPAVNIGEAVHFHDNQAYHCLSFASFGCKNTSYSTISLPRPYHVGGVQELICSAWETLAPRLVRPAVNARLTLGAPPLGFVNIIGGPGTGKSTLAGMLAGLLRSQSTSLTNVVWVDCRGLLGRRTNDVEECIRGAWHEARINAPSVIVWDDLDILIPSAEGGETENPAATYFAELFVDLARNAERDENGKRNWVKEWIHANNRPISDCSFDPMRFCISLDRWASCNSHAIACIATGAREGALHVELRRSGLFDQVFPIPKFDQKARKQVLQAMIFKKQDNKHSLHVVESTAMERDFVRASTDYGKHCSVFFDESCLDAYILRECDRPMSAYLRVHSDVDLYEIALSTDGYRPSDLEIVLTRACSCGASRCMHEAEENAKKIEDDLELRALQQRERQLEAILQDISDESIHTKSEKRMQMITEDRSNRLKLQQSDFFEALKGFVPVAMRGAKLMSSDVRWDDVGGLVEVRRQLKETLEMPTIFGPLYKQAPIKLPSGVMLYGPPGCGKTMLAAAVASECGLNFISVKGPEILDKYIGGSEQNIRDLFARAASASPSILFFDEFESIAPRRGADSSGVTDRVVNQLLTFLDGVEERDDVYVMAASSRPDLVDPALLRPGRLDKPLYCGFPDEDERMAIFQAVARHFDLSDDCGESQLRQCAKDFPEFTGADIQVCVLQVFFSSAPRLLTFSLQSVNKSVSLYKIFLFFFPSGCTLYCKTRSCARLQQCGYYFKDAQKGLSKHQTLHITSRSSKVPCNIL